MSRPKLDGAAPSGVLQVDDPPLTPMSRTLRGSSSQRSSSAFLDRQALVLRRRDRLGMGYPQAGSAVDSLEPSGGTRSLRHVAEMNTGPRAPPVMMPIRLPWQAGAVWSSMLGSTSEYWSWTETSFSEPRLSLIERALASCQPA